MQIHRNKSLNFGFAILSPEADIGLLRTTARSIKNNYGSDAFYVCAVPKNTTAEELEEMNAICPTFRGNHTFTSLINKVLAKGHKEWNLIVMAGSIVRGEVIHRYGRFVQEETDILFPIVMDYNRDGEVTAVHSYFPDAPLNSIFIHQKTFKKVGKFGDNPLDIEKLLWADEAMHQGCQFKAVLGTKLI